MTETLAWLPSLDADDGKELIRLMNLGAADGGILGFPSALDGAEAREVLADLSADLQRGRRHLLVARAPGHLLGAVLLTPSPLPNCRHTATLSRAIIDPRFRGEGILERALLVIVERCRLLGVEQLTMDVRAGTRAEVVWRAFGFEPYGELPDYARVNGRSFSGIYMRLRVNDLEARVRRRHDKLAQQGRFRESAARDARVQPDAQPSHTD